ncbi:MAG TPA: hypothetical protein VME45_16715 [Stellaceae bacterium]|nr:hypothetical protein [Stellaceae bacterium]
MKLAQRAALSRRIEAAEAVVAERVRARAVALLADEHRGGNRRTQQIIEAAMVKMAAGGLVGAERDPVGAVLAEIARSAPAVARRVAAAVGIEVPTHQTTES